LQPNGGMTPIDSMLDLLDHGCDGEPRWIALDAANAHDAASLVRVVAAEAERRGYLPLSADRFPTLAAQLPQEYRQRTFALLQTCRAPARPDPSVLVAAAAINARPHVLVTIAFSGDDTAGSFLSRSPTRAFGFDAEGAEIASSRAQPLMVREARSVYAPMTTAHAAPAVSPESLKHIARAESTLDLARRGRHEPAIRVVREAFASLLRRPDGIAACRAGVILGRLLLERGGPQAAERAFSDAASAVDRLSPTEAARARVWVALARTDAASLTDAESVLRAIKVSGAFQRAVDRRWTDAALARCLLWQKRAAEAVELCESGEPYDPGVDAADAFLVVHALATDARALLAVGRIFDAGQRARAAVEWADRSRDPLLDIVALTAHMRVLAAAGDAELVAERKGRALDLARQLHLPLRALRVRAIWADMLRRAGRTREAAAELRLLARASKAVPRLLRRSIEELRATRERPVASVGTDGVPFALALLRATRHDQDEGTATRAVLERFALEARVARVELQSAVGGVLSTAVATGRGLVPHLGQRSVEAGIAIGPECIEGAWEAAAPIRVGHRVLGVVCCRWPVGREPHPRAVEWLELVTTVVAPHVELFLVERTEAARAAVEIPELIGVSAAIADLRRGVARAASAPFAVLVEGESGVGKELVARAIHHLSARRERRFCDVNCAALPDDLVESELFGHAKGAFTGALVERPGLFEEANGGTLFLDELPDLSLRAQAKLLRVLQQGEIRRVGDSFSRRVDVRLITATNRPMTQEVAEGRFRQDLLYRLDVIRIRIPPLRERPEDVPVLARHFWSIAANRVGTRAVISHRVVAELARYHWPGNVRELQNVMSALAVAAPSHGAVRATLLPPAISGSVTVSSARLHEARQQFERRFIEVALARAGGSRTRAAAQLGISRQGLLKLMGRLGMAGKINEP
jgi:DNA-binding NtrC family response regulator/tetratricopeptide (TPR) repeat protein